MNNRNRRLFVASAAAIFIIVIAAGWYFWPHRSPILTDKDTIVLADFTNSTGDPVFDGTLRQGLSVQLEQSPFLSLVSEERIRQTLRLMDKPPDAALTPEIMRDLCQRVGSKSYIRGSVDKLGNAYVIGLDAINCATGDSLAEEQVQGSGKEKVLDALGHAATDLRRKLGESLTTVEKYDTPLEQATTQSLEALKAYSLGRKANDSGDPMAAVPLLQQAILLDPKFAMAYAALGTSYNNYSETSEAAENAKKAYGLRESVSVREKFYIESRYCQFVTGDLEKARQVYEPWAQAYPRDDLPMTDLGVVYDSPGQYDGGLAVSLQALRLNPASGNNRANLVSSYLCLNRLKEARAAAEEAQAKKIDSPSFRYYLAGVDFLQNDAAALARDLAWFSGKPGLEEWALRAESDLVAYSGQLDKARDLTRRAVFSAQHDEQKDEAGGYEAEAALREALFGNPEEARQLARAALRLSTGRDVQYGAALAFAFVGDISRAQKLADDLARRFPEDTVVQYNCLPTLQAQLALDRKDPSKAIKALQFAAPYELGTPANIPFVTMYPVFVRGEACLAARQGSRAAAEFQKILDHAGIVIIEPIGALAHLGLARAYALQAHSAQGADAQEALNKSRAACQDFLTLWKDADPDIPVLKQAKAEYARLK